MESDKTTALSVIENDDFYSQFLQSSTRSSLQKSLSISEQVKKLTVGIDLLNKELHQLVLDKHGDLLQQAHHATKLEAVLNRMNNHVQNLFSNAERLRLQINGPYQTLETHTKVLGRLHLASHILRQVSRIQQLSKRLNNTSDPIQKATILQELEQLASDPDLIDIDAITTELRSIRSEQQKVIKLANSLITQGLLNENLSQATNGIQILINLGSITTSLDNFIEIAVAECEESLKSTFDPRVHVETKMKGAPGKVNLVSSQGFRNRIWSDLEKAFGEEIYGQCKQIKFLEVAITGLDPDLHIAAKFWEKLGEIFKVQINNAPASVLQMLEEEYPKLLKCYCDLTNKLNYDKFIINKKIFEKCENGYLTASWTKLLDPVQNMFSQETTPSNDHIDGLIRNITEELSHAMVEDSLVEKVAKNVTKCIKLYAVKTEQILASGPEAAQVIGASLNSSQQSNLKLANLLYYLQSQINRIINNMKSVLSSASIEIIENSLSALESLTGIILQPLISSINSMIENIIITIHMETDWVKLPVSTRTNIPCSPYMRELVQFINRIYPMYLNPFENKEVLSTKCSEIALRAIELQVRHTVILRPISQGGRIRLQSDYAYMEQALKIMCPFLTDLGRPYRLFKSIATLITLQPSDIVAKQLSGSSVPHSTVLFMLFSYANMELASPHQNTGWSINKLSNWLDEHTSESDRLDLIAGALQRYETIIRQKKLTNFDPVYPVMSELLSHAVKQM